MAKAIDKGTLIGILDIHGKEIANGDRIRVQYVNNKGSPKENIVEEFNADVFYYPFMAAFVYVNEEIDPREWNDNFHRFNNRSSKFEVLEDEE